MRVGIGRRLADAPNVKGNEEEAVRIHMAVLDEALGLFRTTARVVRVDQAAPVVHELLQVATGTRQALAEVVR